MRKKIVILLAILGALFISEIARERIAYVLRRKQLETVYWQVNNNLRTENGLSRKDVEKIIGTPEISVRQSDGTELWTWTLRNRQGWLWTKLGLARDTGHYELDIAFDPVANRVADVYSGVN